VNGELQELKGQIGKKTLMRCHWTFIGSH